MGILGKSSGALLSASTLAFAGGDGSPNVHSALSVPMGGSGSVP